MKKLFSLFLCFFTFLIFSCSAFAIEPALSGALAWGAAQASGATFLIPQNMDTDLFGKTIGIGTDWSGPVEINISDSYSGYSTVSIHGNSLYDQLQNFTNTEIVPNIEVGQNITFSKIYGTVGGYPLTYYRESQGRYYTSPFGSISSVPGSMTAPFGGYWHAEVRENDPAYFNFFVGSSDTPIIRRVDSLPYYSFLGVRISSYKAFAASGTIKDGIPDYNSNIDINAPIKLFSSTLNYNSSGAFDLPSNTDSVKHALTMTVPTGDLDAGKYDNETDINDILSYIADLIENQTNIISAIVIDDQPAPSPTPRPTTPPASDILGGINDIIGQLDEGLNDIKLDNYNIIESLNDINITNSEILESLNDIDVDIEDQTAVISGAIDQAISDVQTAIGEQTAALEESLSATSEGVQEIAEALQPGEIEPKQFDLRRLFPFCIPFDIHNLLQKFNATPVAPHVQLPFVIQSLGFSYTFDLDFSAFDPVAQAMRTVEFIVFAIGLAWATSKVIKW